MIVDTSALMCMILGEPEREQFADVLRAARSCRMSTANYLETGIVVDRRGHPGLSRLVETMIHRLKIELVPVLSAHARIARQAYRDYGKGSGHPARLNFGDCFAYALAVDADEPLLYKGDDFVHTDVRAAVRPA